MAVRGRKPKPPALKVVGGNAGKRPINTDAPEGQGDIGEPPKYFRNKDARAIWDEVVAAAPEGVLTGSDRHLVELTCRLLAQARSIPVVDAPTATQLRCCLNEMGMTPSARSRLTVPKAPSNPFADLDD